MLRITLPLLTAFSALVLSSCMGDLKEKLSPTPDASSGVNQIAILADEDLWESSVGDSLRYYYQAPYPILNQPEPQFDLRHFTPQDLIDRDIFRELRAYIILADMSDTESPTAKLIQSDIGEERVQASLNTKSYAAMTGKDKWANGQQLNYLFSNSKEGLVDGILKSFPAISQRVRKHNREVLDAEVYFEGLDKDLMEKVRNKVGVDIKIPANFELAREEEDFLWYLYDRNKSVSNLIFYITDYNDARQLDKEAIKSLRDSVTGQYIQSSLDSTYMVVNDNDLPMFSYTRDINGQYAIETRGIWEMVNDFMGGPFNAFVIVDQENGKLILVDGFVYAPGEAKRNLMQKLTHIIETSRLVNNIQSESEVQ